MNRQRGVVLIAVLLLLTVLAGLSLWVGQGGVLSLRLTGDQQRLTTAKTLAQAGMSDLLWRAERTGLCDGYQNLNNVAFAGHTYSATISPTNGSPVKATVTAKLDDGETTYTLLRESQPLHAPPTSLTQAIQADSYIDGRLAYASDNYANSGTLLVGNSGGSQQIALLQFPASELPTAGKIESAVLGFAIDDLSSDDVTDGGLVGGLLGGLLGNPSAAGGGADVAQVNIHRIREVWNPSAVTWDSPDGSASWNGALAYDPDPAATLSVSIADAGWAEVDVTQLVQFWVDGTYVNAGFAITPGVDVTSVTVASMENATLPEPQLTLVYRCECGVDCTPGAQALPDALAHWRLDETSGFTAFDSIGSHDGTTSGTIWTEGADVGAAAFDGVDDYIAVPHDNAFELSDITITAWVRPRTFGPLTNGWRTIVTKGETSPHEDFWLGLNRDELEFGLLVSNTSYAVTTAGANLQLDTWTHVAATFSTGSDEVKLYINGILEEAGSMTVDPSTSNQDVQIGRSKFGEYWDGRLDDIRLYDQVLSQSQIALIRDSAVAPVAGGNIFYALDEFGSRTYSNSDGTRDWTGDWVESGDSSGATGGDVQVTSDLVRNYVLEVSNANNQVERQVDLADCSTLSVTTEYRQVGLDPGLWIWPPDEVAIEVSVDGGTNWETLTKFVGPATNLIYASGSWTAASAPSADTRIRIRSNDRLSSSDQVFFDNFKVQGSGCE